MKILALLLCFASIVSCQRNEPNPEQSEELYFPTNSEWETIDKSTLGIDDKELKELKVFLVDNKSRAFLILKNGKIVVEEYFGKDLLKINNFKKESQWYWASAGKGLTAFTVGLAQEQGFLKINDKTSNYLGENWTTLSKSKEALITIKHQLSMTTGLDSDVPDSHCFAPECLKYKADAGIRWIITMVHIPYWIKSLLLPLNSLLKITLTQISKTK